MHIWFQKKDQILAAAWENQQNDLCAQRRFRSAWASSQSDQSLHCPPEVTLGPQLPIKYTAKTTIRLGRCPGWSESSLGAQVSLLVLSCCRSFFFCYFQVLKGPVLSDLYAFPDSERPSFKWFICYFQFLKGPVLSDLYAISRFWKAQF